MNKAVFLDRDGVINEIMTERVKFVNDASDFYLLDGVAQAINKINNLGYKVYVVTNQGGIGYGFMSEEQLYKIHGEMLKELNVLGATIDEIVYCPHKKDENCECRKPKPQMLYGLSNSYNISLGDSFMVGDGENDIEAGNNAGTYSVFLSNEYNEDINANLQFKNLLDFANWLENNWLHLAIYKEYKRCYKCGRRIEKGMVIY